MDLYSFITLGLAAFAVGTLAGHWVGYDKGFRAGFHFTDRRNVGQHIANPHETRTPEDFGQ